MALPFLLMASATSSGGTATISTVGSTVVSSSTSISVDPTAIGDILIVAACAGTGITISGGGVTTWNTLVTEDGANKALYIWMGVITTAGSATITLSALSFNNFCQQFHRSSGSWTEDSSGGPTTGSSGVETLPSLTPSHAQELYVGFMCSQYFGFGAGSTSGYTYNVPSSSYDGFCFNQACSSSAQAPSFSSGVSTWAAIGTLIK